MRSRFKMIVTVLCTLALAVTPTFAAWGNTSSGEMTASDVKYANVGSAQRIDSFKLDNLYSYESLGNDPNKPTLTLSTSALQNIVKNKLLPQWSGLAASIFRDQAGQLVDLYGEQANGGNMSQAGFDAYFNMGKGGSSDKYKNEKWSCYNLSSKLGQTYASHAGDPGWDQFIITGVKQVSSLSQARNMMGQALRDSEKTNAISAQEFLDVTDGNDNERLEGLNKDDQTTGFANVVAAVNCKGSSADFDYVSFGIVFYDFDMVPVAAEGLGYVNGGFKSATNDKGAQSSLITNGQQQDIVHSAKLGDAVTQTTSTTLSGLASFEMSENIGANIGWSETESSSETEFWADDDSFGSSTSTSSETNSMGLNWGTAWKMGGKLGAEQGHSESKEVSKAVETTIALPAHTAATIDHTTSTTTYSQTYQQPVILSYKVAIFAMSGDFYSSSAFGGIGRISADSYDKQSLVIKFDTEDKATPFYGCTATDDLYGRAITNIDVQGYDAAEPRTYSSHSTRSDFSKSADINWASVMSTAQSYYGVNVAENVAKKNYFYETPGKLNVEKDKTSSEAQPIYPLYDLATVTTPKTNYVLYSNNTMDRTSLPVQGYNKFGVPFYGFTSELGEWCRCDENGEFVNGGELLDSDPVELVAGTLVPKANTTGGTIYLRWVANPNLKPKTGEHLDGQDLANPRIASPVVTIDVVNAGLDNPKVTAEGGYTGFYGTPVNLNSVIKYEVTDSDDKLLDVQAKWESRESASYGIRVNENTGEVTFTKPGTYQVRPYVVNNQNKKVYPNWVTITAAEHNLVHYAAKDPTCMDDGWNEHYRCSEPGCGKYFSDAEGKHEISEEGVFIAATDHVWGDWVTTKEASGDQPGEQKRECTKDSDHVETRALYTVQFNMNGHGTAPDMQTVASGASVKVPLEPTTTGYTFGGWFADPECTVPYDFGAAVTGNLDLYAKWSTAKYTVATMAVGKNTQVDSWTVTNPKTGEEVVESTWAYDSDVRGALTINGGETITEDGYTVWFKEVEYGSVVTMTAMPDDGYGLRDIMAASAKGDEAGYTFGEPFTPNKMGSNVYSFMMPDADVAVLASFDQVTLTYDGNAPEDATVSDVPDSQTIAYGSTPQQPATNPKATGNQGAKYEFGGWYTEDSCTNRYSFMTPATQDQTLYAKWVKTQDDLLTVTYTLYNAPGSDPESYTDTDVVEKGQTAHNPTDDLNALIAGSADYNGYELYSFYGNYWFTDKDCKRPYDFASQITTNNTHLYAKIVPKQYIVSFYADKDAPDALKIEHIDYGTTIKAVAPTPAKEGYSLASWKNSASDADWDPDAPVIGDLTLYAKMTINSYDVTFDANGHGTAPDAQKVEHGKLATEPAAPEEEGYAFGGWFTDQACAKAYDFATPVTADLTLYAKMTINSYDVTFDANGHGDAPAAQTVDHGATASDPGKLSAEGQAFGGWFTDQACAKAYDFATPVTADLTLYAKWTINSYGVTFDANGHGDAPAAQTVDHGATASDPGKLSAEGQAFGGWFTDQACTKAYDFATPVTAGLTLYAKWTAETASTPAQTSIAKAKVTLAQTSYAYDGKAKEPAVKSVVLDGKTLNAGTDYDVSYKDNVKAGTATVTVTGKGVYKDSATATFTIAKVSIAKAKVTLAQASCAYDGKAKKPAVKSVVLNGKTLKVGTDYAVSYKNNKKLGKATVTVTGKGGYQGSANATFKIILGKVKLSTDARAKSVVASWKKVPGAKSYQLKYKQVGGKWKTVKVKGTSKTVKNLKANGLYQFRVRAVAGKQKGAWSATSNRYLRSLKGANAKVKKAGTVTVAWKADSKANAGYSVAVRYKKGGKVAAKANAAKGKTKATVKGLKAGKKLWVEVCPMRKSGKSTYSGVQQGMWAKATSGLTLQAQSADDQPSQDSGLTAASV